MKELGTFDGVFYKVSEFSPEHLIVTATSKERGKLVLGGFHHKVSRVVAETLNKTVEAIDYVGEPYPVDYDGNLITDAGKEIAGYQREIKIFVR